MKKETEQKIGQLQLMEQSLQALLVQKQQFQTQLVELESALKELEKKDYAYKIIGSIMVKATKEEIEKELKSKIELVKLRIKSIEKQEANIKEKASSLQKEIMSELKK